MSKEEPPYEYMLNLTFKNPFHYKFANEKLEIAKYLIKCCIA